MVENDELGAVWRSEILNSFTRIPSTGAVPGGLVVWGETARPILCSAECDDPLIAAAEIGCGRIIVVAHEGLITTGPKELRESLERWLTRGDQRLVAEKHVLGDRSSITDLRPRGLLEWLGGGTGRISGHDVINHVANGGSLLHAMCPWGWLQLNPGKTFSYMPLFDTLCLAGIGYTGSYGRVPKEGLDVVKYCASEKNHTMLMFNQLMGDLRLTRDTCPSVDLPTINLMAIPDQVRKEIIVPKVKHLYNTVGTTGSDDLIKVTPHPKCPVKDKASKAVMNILECAAQEEDSELVLPGVDTFPGDFSCCPNTVCAVVEFSASFQDTHSTGYYLPPRCTLTVRVAAGVNPAGWFVQVGCHTDDLNGQKELRRWPKVTSKRQLTKDALRLYSPFGGLIYLESPSKGGDINVQLENVIEAPQFILSNEASRASWKARRNSPGLWADMIGEMIMITLPSSSVRNLNDPTDVMQTWDRVVRAHHHLRGTDPTGARKEWIVCDEQPSAGYMHSGHPIVTHLDIADPKHELFILNNTMLKTKGTWGLYHELGHNMQRNSWTFNGTVEVTCNIFTLHAMEVISGKCLWIHEWLQNQLKKVHKYVTSTSDGFSVWQSDPGVALFIYAQIAHEFGWEPYKKAFRAYEHEGIHDLPSPQEKINTWFQNISKACGYNLKPLFDFWKIPVTSEDKMIGLPYYMPDDDVTQMNPPFVRQLLHKYPNCYQKTTTAIR